MKAKEHELRAEIARLKREVQYLKDDLKTLTAHFDLCQDKLAEALYEARSWHGVNE